MQKPVIIYSMPRTRSTATLEACKRSRKIFEPFNPFKLFDINFYNTNYTNEVKNRMYADAAENISCTYASYANKINPEKLNSIFAELDSPDVVCKIICNDLIDFLPGRKWFESSTSGNAHDVFVLVRDLREQMFSYLLAGKFGYYKKTEQEKFPVEISPNDFRALRNTLDSFLRFLPADGTLLEYKSLPDTHFDYSSVALEEQHSMDKLEYITNLDYCEYQVNELIKYYRNEWIEKISQLKS